MSKKALLEAIERDPTVITKPLEDSLWAVSLARWYMQMNRAVEAAGDLEERSGEILALAVKLFAALDDMLNHTHGEEEDRGPSMVLNNVTIATTEDGILSEADMYRIAGSAVGRPVTLGFKTGDTVGKVIAAKAVGTGSANSVVVASIEIWGAGLKTLNDPGPAVSCEAIYKHNTEGIPPSISLTCMPAKKGLTKISLGES